MKQAERERKERGIVKREMKRDKVLKQERDWRKIRQNSHLHILSLL